MGSTRLVFQQPRHVGGNPVPLVFGAGGQAEVPSYAITARGRITGLRGQVRMASVLQVQAKGRITGLRGSVAVAWSVNVARPMTASASDAAQPAERRAGQLTARWEQAQAACQAVQQVWQDAQRIAAQVQALWQDAQQLRSVGAEQAQEASALRHGVQHGWQEAVRLNTWRQDVSQQAQPLRASTFSRLEEAGRVRGVVVNRLQQGQVVGGCWPTSFGRGVPVRVGVGGWFEEAMKPGPGRWGGFGPVPPEPCYVPSLPARLLFNRPGSQSGLLLFKCCKGGGDEPPAPVAQYVIPLLRVYMQVHTLTAQLLPGLEPVVLQEVTISTDDDSYCWSLSAAGPEHLLEQLQGTAGLPARIRISIDGIPFVFAVTALARSRSFERRRVSVQGVSVTSMLGAPYMPQQTWLSDADMTAQQLATAALEYTGVTLDWGISDWLVPAGAWSHKGTPLQSVLRIAESVGAVVRSHRTDEQLIIAPRYPVLPWEWADATPDVQMPAAVIVTDELRPDARADYNAVYVLGGAVGGVKGHIVRALSARDKLAPAIQDDLITHADAARMRGSWALAASGNKRIQSISMPVLTGGTNPGVLQPGQLLEVDDTDGAWRGLVRAVSVGASMSKVRQQVTVERVAEEGITA